MHVAIDWSLCVGSGLCLAEAPGALVLVPFRGELRAALMGTAADESLWAAARACPTLAIRLRADTGQMLYPPENDADRPHRAASRA